MWAENHTIDDRVEQQRWPPLSSRQNVGQCILPPLDLSPWWFSTAQSSVCSTLLLVAYRNGNHYLLLFTALCTFNSISVINWIKLFTVNWIFFMLPKLYKLRLLGIICEFFNSPQVEMKQKPFTLQRNFCKVDYYRNRILS